MSGQCGVKDVDVISPRLVELLAHEIVGFVACGLRHSGCVANGRLYTFGSDDDGQLGRQAYQGQTYEPGLVGGLNDVRKIALGAEFSVCLCGDGSVFTFGRGKEGQLGNGLELDVCLSDMACLVTHSLHV